MKNPSPISIILLVLSSGIFVQGNALSISEYYDLTFDGISIKDISETDGNSDQIQALFDNNLTINKGFSDAVEHWVKFTSQSICIDFYNGITYGRSSSVIRYDLASVVLLKSTSQLRLKNRVIRIGDPLDQLSGTDYRTVSNKRIHTFGSKFYDSYVYIYADINTNSITEIGYEGNLL